MERRYSVPPPPNNSTTGPSLPVEQIHQLGSNSRLQPGHPAAPGQPSASEDLHAWSIYRQNLNSDFTDSALGSSEKSPLPYGNFQLRESTVQSILSHPRYGPKSALGANMYTYLKFGLPRVFPPSRGPKDGSSGYDSSEDGSPYLHRQGRNYLRSRSDPDFRNQPLHKSYTGHGPRPGVPHRPGGEGWNRTKSSSEANLLSQETYLRHHEHRRSVHDLRGLPYHDVQQPGLIGSQMGGPRRVSQAGSHASLAHSRRGNQMSAPLREEAVPINGSRLGPVSEAASPNREAYYSPMPDQAGGGPVYKYPHLQVRGLEVESRANKRLLLLQGICFEVHGGEIMAVMATTEEEGTGLLDVLSGRQSRVGKIRGDVLLNGRSVRSDQLRGRVAYVQSDSHLSPDLSVRHTLALHHRLRRSANSRTDKVQANDRIDALIEDLGLDQVGHTKVAGLTTSERRRLNVACHLLLDTEVVVLDQPTRGMDIFDTFFLVEFLRQFAGNNMTSSNPGLAGGRIVILTLHPPTYEIFTMLSRVVLLSAGRLMYGGRRRNMLPYFAMVEYPCPAYKNPSDYYLDLVTLDDLSAEAMLESSQRIEQLAEMFRRRQEPLSDPGPPIALPPAVHQTNCITQIFILFMRALLYTQPSSLVRWLTHVLLAAALSFVIGAVFWDVPSTDPQLVLSDRPGFHQAIALVGAWPLLLQLSLGEVHRERWSVDRDIGDGLYGRLVYIFTKVIYNLPVSSTIWLAYLIPAYAMSGLHVQGIPNAFYLYIGYMLLYLLSLQMLLTALALALRHRHVSVLLGALFLTCLSLVSGLGVHKLDVRVWCGWLRMVSPAHWVLPVLLQRELTPAAVASSAATLVCRNKQVQHQDIIVQRLCPPTNGTAALQYLGLMADPRQPEYVPPLAVAVGWFVCLLVAASCFMICRYRPSPPRNNPNKP